MKNPKVGEMKATKFTLTEVGGMWLINQSDSEGNSWPSIEKPDAKSMLARLAQLLETGPIEPQTYPEKIMFIMPEEE